MKTRGITSNLFYSYKFILPDDLEDVSEEEGEDVVYLGNQIDCAGARGIMVTLVANETGDAPDMELDLSVSFEVSPDGETFDTYKNFMANGGLKRMSELEQGDGDGGGEGVEEEYDNQGIFEINEEGTETVWFDVNTIDGIKSFRIRVIDNTDGEDPKGEVYASIGVCF